MTIEEAIKKAVKEGGYSPKEYIKRHYYISKEGNRAKSFGSNMSESEILIDPSFWQSLGMALGWNPDDYRETGIHNHWRYHWHRFIDHLAEGKDAESFFHSL